MSVWSLTLLPSLSYSEILFSSLGERRPTEVEGIARVIEGRTEAELEPWFSAHALWGFSVNCTLGWLIDAREGQMDSSFSSKSAPKPVGFPTDELHQATRTCPALEGALGMAPPPPAPHPPLLSPASHFSSPQGSLPDATAPFRETGSGFQNQHPDARPGVG